MYQEETTSLVLSKAFEVHTILGPGLLESAYRECLYYELHKAGLQVKREFPIPFLYKELELEYAYRIDILVNQTIVIELKTVECLHPVHHAQVLTYMRLGGYSVGLLLNFNTVRLKDGIKRFILTPP